MKLSRHFLIYSLTDLLGKCFGLITSPLSTRLLTPEQFGALWLLDGLWAVFGLPRFMGHEEAYTFFKANPKPGVSARTLVSTATVNITVCFFAVWAAAGAALFLAPWADALTKTDRTTLLLFFLSLAPASLNYWFQFLLRFENHPVPYARITIANRACVALLILPALMLFTGAQRLGALYGLILGLETGLLVYTLKMLGRLGLFPYIKKQYDRMLGLGLLRYGAVLIPGAAVYALSAQSGRLMLGAWQGPADVALLGLAGTVAAPILLLKRWFSFVWAPALSEWVATQDPARYRPRIQAILKILGAVFFPVAALSALWTAPVLPLVYPEYYTAAARLVPPLVLAGAFSVLCWTASTCSVIANRARYHLPVYALGLAVNATVCLIGIRCCGVLGAALGPLAGEIAILASWILIERSVLKNLNLSWRGTFLAAAAALAFVLWYPAQTAQALHTTFWRLALSLPILIAPAAYLFLRRKELQETLEDETPAAEARTQSPEDQLPPPQTGIS